MDRGCSIHEMELIYIFLVICLTALQEVKCDCGYDKSSESCWYTFWYIWVALALFVAVLITIMVFYYKHKSRHRTRVRRLSAARPQNPPPYSEPSQLPPSYEDAIKDSLPVPPGYVTDYRIISQYHNNRGQSDISIISFPPVYNEGPPQQPPRQQNQPHAQVHNNQQNRNNQLNTRPSNQQRQQVQRNISISNRNQVQPAQSRGQRNTTNQNQSSQPNMIETAPGQPTVT